ncbi:MAG: RagB/SusD family nutrient uptake outer membrane protein, partial [Cyclobacteriaceae bacterium]|nr:RagB/SusD family nutrient uptake outer membrane protein [Cyclobacteriaceae bacterium]
WDFYRELDTYQLDASNLEVTNFYTAAYRAVNQANNIIASVPNINMPQANKDNIIGQAYFVRALAFFDLNRVFGGVPGVHGEKSVVLPLSPSRGVNESLYPSRPSLAEGYSQVEADLLQALSLLPEQQSSIAFSKARAVKSTARALLSRLYLYLKNYPQVISLSSEVINDSKYTLMSNYLNIFATDFSGESIFELEFIAADQSAMRFWYFPGAQGGRGELAVHEQFIAAIQADQNDVRGKMFGFDAVQGVYYPTKYQKAGNIDNAHIIRIAEMYLNRAEAYAQTPSTLNLAIADLNAIKQRAGAALYSGALTQEAVLLEIEKERKFEFAFEGHSFFDLVRTGRAMAV